VRDIVWAMSEENVELTRRIHAEALEAAGLSES
jgi:hypothetical protein